MKIYNHRSQTQANAVWRSIQNVHSILKGYKAEIEKNCSEHIKQIPFIWILLLSLSFLLCVQLLVDVLWYDKQREKSDSNKHVIAIIVCTWLLLLTMGKAMTTKKCWLRQIEMTLWGSAWGMIATFSHLHKSFTSWTFCNKFLICSQNESKRPKHNVIDYKI
jgi:hypothetical protein